MRMTLVTLFIILLASTPGFGSQDPSYGSLLEILQEKGVLTPNQVHQLQKRQPASTETRPLVRPSSSVLQDLQVRGRIQAQVGHVESNNNEGFDKFNTLEMRRVRMGMRATLLDQFRAELEANIVPGSNLSMRTAYIQWRKHSSALLKLGYDKPWTSLDENTSSAEILTVERSLINDTLTAPGPQTGLSLDGNWQLFSYGLGIYTDRDNRNPSGEPPRYLYNAKFTVDFTSLWNSTDTLRLHIMYTDSEDKGGKIGAKQVGTKTAGLQYTRGSFDLRGEHISSDNNQVHGWYAMPSYYLTTNTQLVVRYQEALDKQSNLLPSSRYTRDIPALQERDLLDGSGNITGKINPQKGKNYQAAYLGANYYFSGHEHKLIAAVELAQLNNTQAGLLKTTTYYAAWRMLF